MQSEWTFPLIYAVGVIAVLESIYIATRRLRRSFPARLQYHLWAVSLALLTALAMAQVDPQSSLWLTALGASILLTALILYALVDALILQRPWAPSSPPMMPRLVRDILRLGMVVAVALWIATAILRQPLGTVLVSSTVLSAVVGLALQDVLKNVFAGMSLEIEKPFERGDWLMLDGDVPACVIDMSWRSTHLRTREAIDIWEPNVKFANARLVNYGSGKHPVGLGFRIGLPYDASPAQVKTALRAAAESVPETVAQPAVSVFVESWDDHSIGYYLRAWTHSVADQGRYRDRVNSRIWYELKRHGLSVPFPIRTVHLHAADQIADRERHEAEKRVLRLFSSLDLFSEVEPEAVQELASSAERRFFDHGETLVVEGEEGSSLFVIESGAAEVQRSVGDGPEASHVAVAQLAVGDFFGEHSLLTGEPRGATVTAEGGCIVLALSKEAVAPILKRDPRIVEALSRALAKRQSENIESIESHRDRLRQGIQTESEGSVLRRIRSFFKL